MRRKGRFLNGWMLIDKPAGVGSTDVVNKLRWLYDARKAGHAGTLDPAATGLLVVGFGEATKLIPYIMDDLKCYEFSMQFGSATTTDDAEGEVIERSDARPNEAQIRAALPQFTGEIMQTPPAFSAVRIEGKRAYDLAREGVEVELSARPLFVEALELTEYDPSTGIADLYMICGKGGYVRAIARDLGKATGSLGHVLSLRRVWSSAFDVDDAIDFNKLRDLSKEEREDDLIRPIGEALTEIPEIALKTPEHARKLQNGNAVPVLDDPSHGEACWASYRGKLLAIGAVENGMFQPERVIVDHEGTA